VSEFFATSAPDPTYRTLNLCFGGFHSVRMHLGLFCYDSKLGAKRAELVQLMQKYMSWSHIGIIRNKCARSTALDPNLMFGAFHSVWVHLESFFYCKKLGAKRAKLVQLMQKFVPKSCIGIFAANAPDPPHWTPNSCFVAFRSVLLHLGPFRDCMKFGAKWTELVQLMQKFVPRSCVRIFRNEHTWSNP